jgi:hypothetical protein
MPYAKEESSDSTGSMAEYQSNVRIFGLEHYRDIRFWRCIRHSDIAFLGEEWLIIYFFGSEFEIVSYHMPKEESSDSTGSMAEYQSNARIFGLEHYRDSRFWKCI